MAQKSLLSKRQWFKRLPDSITPGRNLSPVFVNGHASIPYSQQRMLDEYFPTSHDIHNRLIYPDIPHEIDEEVVINAETGETKVVTRTYIEPLPRTAMSYQQIIETKRTDHLTGNDTVFNRNWSEQNDQKDADYQELVDGWEQHDMEDAIYEAVHNANITGDVAVVQYIYTDPYGEKMLGWNAYSFLKGDEIYAHRDQRTGRTNIFARKFSDDYGEEMVEVWDNRKYYLFKAPTSDNGLSVQKVIFDGGFELDGYALAEVAEHGFNRCPVAYHRNEDGPVWAFSQDSIEAYEEDFNGLRHNNKAYGNPILVTKGDDVEGVPELDGTVKNINMGKDDDAKLLQGASASESYMSELDKLEDLIYLQSFIVKTPELKSGDLPAAALKIIYSPAVEKAMHEVKAWQHFINDLFDIFRYGFGIINGKTLAYSAANLPIKVFLQPYVHQSESIMVNDLATAVQNKFISRQTASERIPWLAEESEWQRIVSEEKQEQQADLLYETSLANATSSNTTANSE